MSCSCINTIINKNIIHTTVDKYSDKDIFFNSIRKDYNGFDKWLQKIQIENRQCFSVENEDRRLDAILIYKIESIKNNPLFQDIKVDASYVIKISTFKVEKPRFGTKVGELFLNKIIKLALIKGFIGVYITTFPNQVQLIHLFSIFGFKILTKNEGELILYKSLIKDSVINNSYNNYQENLL